METRVVAGSAGTSSGHTDLSNEHPDVELAHGQARIRKQTSQAKRQSSGVPLGLRQCPLNRRDSLGASPNAVHKRRYGNRSRLVAKWRVIPDRSPSSGQIAPRPLIAGHPGAWRFVAREPVGDNFKVARHPTVIGRRCVTRQDRFCWNWFRGLRDPPSGPRKDYFPSG